MLTFQRACPTPWQDQASKPAAQSYRSPLEGQLSLSHVSLPESKTAGADVYAFRGLVIILQSASLLRILWFIFWQWFCYVALCPKVKHPKTQHLLSALSHASHKPRSLIRSIRGGERRIERNIRNLSNSRAVARKRITMGRQRRKQKRIHTKVKSKLSNKNNSKKARIKRRGKRRRRNKTE